MRRRPLDSPLHTIQPLATANWLIQFPLIQTLFELATPTRSLETNYRRNTQLPCGLVCSCRESRTASHEAGSISAFRQNAVPVCADTGPRVWLLRPDLPCSNSNGLENRACGVHSSTGAVFYIPLSASLPVFVSILRSYVQDSNNPMFR
jgi:hypothetical protein